jgi:RHS repeat-associated protein
MIRNFYNIYMLQYIQVVLFSLICISVHSQTSSITWNVGGISTNYTSDKRVCRSNEGYLEFNTISGYYVGFTTAVSPNSVSQMDFGVLVNSSANKIDFYVAGLFKFSYPTISTILSTHKVRIERKGSVINAYYQNTPGGSFNYMYSYNSDANVYYRFHAITTSGGSTASLNAVATATLINPCSQTSTPGADAGINWTQSKVFDGGQPEVILTGESRVFTNRFGEPIQSQSKDFSESALSVIGQETVYDAQGRKVLQTLPAPTGSNNIQYRSLFLQGADGSQYDYADFDLPIATGATGEVNNPKPVGTQSNTVGNYYSNSYTGDGYVPTSSYPYSRVEYALDGSVRRISGPGENHRMGSTHELRTFKVNSGNELNYLYGGRKSFEVSPDVNDPLNNIGVQDLLQNIKALKTVTINADGVRSISYTSTSGLLLAQCVSGRPESTTCPEMKVSHKLYRNARAHFLDEFGTGSVNIHLPASTSTSLKFTYDAGYFLNNTLTANGQYKYCNNPAVDYPGGILENVIFYIYDLAGDKFLVRNTDFTLTASNGVITVAFINTYANKEGFYKITYDYSCEYIKYLYGDYYIPGYEPPITVTYRVDYSEWTINYYDRRGRLIRTVQPQGINCALGDPNLYDVTKYSISKDFYSASTYLSTPFTAATISSIDNSGTAYGPELNIKVRGLLKSGVVMGPSGGNGNFDVLFNENSRPVDLRVTPSPSNPTGGGSYRTLTQTNFDVLFSPPTSQQIDAASYSFPVYNLISQDPNVTGYPTTCFNGELDPGELFVDYGGVCGTSYNINNCTDPPKELASFKITLQYKKGATVIATKDIYRTLGVTCYGMLVEMDNITGFPEAEQVITNAQLGTGSSISIDVVVSDIKVKDIGTGNYNVTYAPATVADHRFIRYILLKTDTEKETYFKNTNVHDLKTTFYYDGLSRMLAVSDPDRGKTEYIFDDEGKVRFSQNAKQRAVGIYNFSYVNYDLNGRVTESGEYKDLSATPYYFPNAYYEADVASSLNLNDSKNLLKTTNRNSTADLFSLTYKSDIASVTYDIPASLPSGAPAAYSTFFGEGRPVKIENAEQDSWLRYNYRGETTGSVLKYNNLNAYDINYKTFDFQYDFFGRLKKSTYQLGHSTEEFSHVYTYNAAGDVKFVETIKTSEPAKRHQFNNYYKTGDIKRIVLGQATQGLDYVYTIDGKLKSINHPLLTNADPGGDGFSGFGGPNVTPTDVFALALDYYPNDYVRTGTSITYGESSGTAERFDSRVKSVRWNTRHTNIQAASGKETMYKYEYDWQQNLARTTYGTYTPNALTNNVNGNGGYGSPVYGTFVSAAKSAYTEQIKDVDGGTEPNNWYDKNGNIKYLKRYDNTGLVMDNLTYNYSSTYQNRLEYVSEAATTYSNSTVNHVLPQSAGNYVYNETGDIKQDVERNIKVVYNSSGQIAEVRNGTNNDLLLAFYYDASGKRVRKISYDNAAAPEKTTLYLRDPGGTTFAIYEDHTTTPSSLDFAQTEVLLDGGALGAHYPLQQTLQYIYNLSDHLGNVRSTIHRDNNGNAPTILSYADYYAWGMTMPGREYTSSPRFRLGYQGQEYESKVGMYGFSLRMYDQRLGRWFSTDPYGQHWSPYLAMSNNPVSFVDPDGGNDWWDRNGVTYYIDGQQVASWEFSAFMGSPILGTQIEATGSLFGGTVDWLATYGKLAEYFVRTDPETKEKIYGWGNYIKFATSEPGRAAELSEVKKANPSELPKGQISEYEVDGGAPTSAPVIGLKWYGFVPPRRPNASIKAHENDFMDNLRDAPILGAVVYEPLDGLYVFWQGFIPSETLQHLDGRYMERGSKEHQDAATAGVMVFAQEVAVAGSAARGVTRLGALADDGGKLASETGINIGMKLEYLFGKATGSAHNIERSKDMLRQLERVGIFDNAAGRSLLNSHLESVYSGTKGILQANGRYLRESLLMGPRGGLKVESIWEGNKLITVKLLGG